MTAYDTLLIDVAEEAAVVTVNRPAVRNALDQQVQSELRSVLDEMRDAPDVGALIFTGAGLRAFVAGADIERLQHYTSRTALTSSMQRLFDEIEGYDKPTIAAVNGFALGGGCELAMACDLRIAAEGARFGLPETVLGILPGAGGTQRLSRLVGLGNAMDLVMTGRVVSAEEALRMGLVSRVVPDAELLATACEVAAQVVARGPLATRLARTVVRAGADTDQRTGQLIERLAQALAYDSEDKAEGVGAFLARRPARFSGR